MYLIKDVRSFSFKLVPVNDNKESISLLQDHKLLKTHQDQAFETFKSSHAHEYFGLEHDLLKNPNRVNLSG